MIMHSVKSNRPARRSKSRSRAYEPQTGGVEHSQAVSTSTSPENILYLQRMVGNQAVQRLLNTSSIQRAGEDEAEGPLTPAQVASAIAWYKAQPKKYTSEINQQIQVAVRTDPTGTMTAVDVQAVAAHQQTINDTETPSLAIDGKAGPRTLPAVFKQGLAPDEEVEGFVANTREEVFSKWTELSVEDRIRELVKEANKRLASVDVPETELIIGDAEGNLGQFDFETWSLEIGKPAFENNAPTPAQQADMANTIYHESRHAEQWFRMAQMLAGQKQTAAQIMKTMQIKKLDVAKAAVDKPLAPGSVEALIADGWFQSVYGSGAAHRNATLTEVSAADKALEKAQAAFTADPTPANQKKLDAALARQAKSREAFFNLPEENDASRVGDRVTAEFIATEPEPEVTP